MEIFHWRTKRMWFVTFDTTCFTNKMLFGLLLNVLKRSFTTFVLFNFFLFILKWFLSFVSFFRWFFFSSVHFSISQIGEHIFISFFKWKSWRNHILISLFRMLTAHFHLLSSCVFQTSGPIRLHLLIVCLHTLFNQIQSSANFIQEWEIFHDCATLARACVYVSTNLIVMIHCL